MIKYLNLKPQKETIFENNDENIRFNNYKCI